MSTDSDAHVYELLLDTGFTSHEASRWIEIDARLSDIEELLFDPRCRASARTMQTLTAERADLYDELSELGHAAAKRMASDMAAYGVKYLVLHPSDAPNADAPNADAPNADAPLNRAA